MGSSYMQLALADIDFDYVGELVIERESDK